MQLHNPHKQAKCQRFPFERSDCPFSWLASALAYYDHLCFGTFESPIALTKLSEMALVRRDQAAIRAMVMRSTEVTRFAICLDAVLTRESSIVIRTFNLVNHEFGTFK